MRTCCRVRVKNLLKSGCHRLATQPEGLAMAAAFDLITPILGLLGATGYMALIGVLLLRMAGA